MKKLRDIVEFANSKQPPKQHPKEVTLTEIGPNHPKEKLTYDSSKPANYLTHVADGHIYITNHRPKRGDILLNPHKHEIYMTPEDQHRND